MLRYRKTRDEESNDDALIVQQSESRIIDDAHYCILLGKGQGIRVNKKGMISFLCIHRRAKEERKGKRKKRYSFLREWWEEGKKGKKEKREGGRKGRREEGRKGREERNDILS